jgi:serine protease
MTRSVLALAAAATGGLLACSGDIVHTSTTGVPSFEEFEATIYHEEFDDGVYIVNGDEPIVDIKALEEYWAMLHSEGALIVHRNGTADAKWSDQQKLNLTYCVSDSFGTRKTTVVNAMNQGTAAWEAVANVNFIHVTAQDASCTASNTNVVFDVRPVSGQPYVARAFFPGNPRSSRNILIDSQAFGNMGAWTLKGVLTHELGHTLGFRHEHTRPEAGRCYEDSSWRVLTAYDPYSVMHYPHCNGRQTGDLVITSLDAQGAAALYGAAGGTPPPPPPQNGTPQTRNFSGSLAQGQTAWIGPYSVLAGTRFQGRMTGSGDPDLYVRFGAWPTGSSYHCRPYLSGASESCDLTVPSGQTSVYLAVHGYTASSYQLTLTYTAP